MMIKLNESEYKITETYFKEGVKQIVSVHLNINFRQNKFDIRTDTHGDNFTFNNVTNNHFVDKALAVNKAIKKAIKFAIKKLKK